MKGDCAMKRERIRELILQIVTEGNPYGPRGLAGLFSDEMSAKIMGDSESQDDLEKTDKLVPFSDDLEDYDIRWSMERKLSVDEGRDFGGLKWKRKRVNDGWMERERYFVVVCCVLVLYGLIRYGVYSWKSLTNRIGGSNYDRIISECTPLIQK